MLAFIIALLAAELLAPLTLAIADTAKVVDLGYAKYRTDLRLDNGVTSFLGIRFAAPPTGDLRWRAPHPPAQLDHIQNATIQPTQCQQASIFGSPGLSLTSPFRKPGVERRDVALTGPTSEDCLFLNVHVPSSSDSKDLLPVVLYFHSGGYDGGNVSAFPVQDFVKESNSSIVVVQSQYRLGLFGFLPGQAVKDDGNLNVGLLDQEFALKWVQKHILKFGGDPTKVTIWGQSAGAGSVVEHIIAHGGCTEPPLFRAAIMNSPFLPFHYHYNDPIPEKLYRDVVSFVNCSVAHDTLACLRSAEASVLLDADTTIGSSNFMETYTFVPVVDEGFIAERPTETLNRGRVNGNIVLLTTNSHEGDFFVNETTLAAANFTLTDYITQLFPRMDDEQIERTVTLYATSEFTSVSAQARAIYGESIIVCPAYYVLEAFHGRGWKGVFAIEPGTHALDLSYEFLTFAIPPTYDNVDFQRAFSEAFISLTVSLDVNRHIDPTNIAPTWPLWADEHSEMLFNKSVTDTPIVEVMTTDDNLFHRCRWWNSIANVNSQ